MKKFLIVLLVIVLVGGAVGGVAYMSKGFKDWNVKDWIKPSADISTPGTSETKPTVKSVDLKYLSNHGVAVGGQGYLSPEYLSIPSNFNVGTTVPDLYLYRTPHDLYPLLPVVTMSDGSVYDISKCEVRLKGNFNNLKEFIGLTERDDIIGDIEFDGHSAKFLGGHFVSYFTDYELLNIVGNYSYLSTTSKMFLREYEKYEMIDIISIKHDANNVAIPNPDRDNFFKTINDSANKVANTNIEVIVEGVSYNFYCNLDYKA